MKNWTMVCLGNFFTEVIIIFYLYVVFNIGTICCKVYSVR